MNISIKYNKFVTFLRKIKEYYGVDLNHIRNYMLKMAPNSLIFLKVPFQGHIDMV